jgi:hypothetical protein
MSIFRSTFNKTTQGQLKARQNALNNRTPQAIIQANSRNSWVRMTSSVDVDGDDGKLANQYILQGGVLYNKSLRYGIGDQSSAYSNTSPSNKPYNNDAKAGTAGLKPMPGIKSVDIKSKTAYGSLREVTVNFSCNNIQQLEDLELLYMRPGYTVLIEWGWTPFLDNEGNLKSNIEFYDGVLKRGKERDQIFLDLFQKSKQYFGNYDAMFGYVKNYNWTARMDGGYDCTTTVISIGEVLESLKVNWVPSNIDEIDKNNGVWGSSSTEATLTTTTSPNTTSYTTSTRAGTFNPTTVLSTTDSTHTDLKAYYAKSILSGLLYELYRKCLSQLVDIPTVSNYKLFAFAYRTNPIPDSIVISGYQVYITLESFLKILNEKVLLQANGKPYITVSTSPSEYDDTLVEDAKDNPENSLLCLAHPLQVSVDPTVCLITNPIWAGGVDTSGIGDGADNGPSSKFDAEAGAILKSISSVSTLDFTAETIIGQRLLKNIVPTAPEANSNATEFVKAFTRSYIKQGKWIIKYPGVDINNFNSIKSSLIINDIYNVLEKLSNNVGNLESTHPDVYNTLFNEDTCMSIIESTIKSDLDIRVRATTLVKKGESQFAVEYLKTLQAKTNKSFQYKDELGKISNIFLNVDMLYRLSINPDLHDQKTQELKLYQYLKQILKEVQDSIGGVNNFEIHVDPQDSVARIIDLNYIDANNRATAYSNAFQIEMANTSGSVRSYSLQSQIFPEQGAMIAISAQVGGGGAQGYQNNTMLNFNNSLEDRIIPKKIAPSPILTTTTLSPKEQLTQLKENLKTIQGSFFPEVNNKNNNAISPNSNIDQSKTSEYKNTLKNIITYLQGITNSNTKNRAIIPIKMSLTMDGIGGLVIGHLFKIPPDLLPRGYKYINEIGAKLLQIVTTLDHKIENGDWTTTIGAQQIVTNEPTGETTSFKDITTTNAKTGETKINLPPTPNADDLRSTLQILGYRAKGIELSSAGDISKEIANAGIAVAKKIKEKLPNIDIVFTSGNDTFHKNITDYTSRHKTGNAIDLTVFPASPNNISAVEKIIQGFAAGNTPNFKFINEYTNPTRKATGGHFHLSWGQGSEGTAYVNNAIALANKRLIEKYSV